MNLPDLLATENIFEGMYGTLWFMEMSWFNSCAWSLLIKSPRDGPSFIIFDAFDPDSLEYDRVEDIRITFGIKRKRWQSRNFNMTILVGDIMLI